MKHNHLDKPHLCGTGLGCMAVVPGGELSCATHAALFSEREREELARAWDTADRDGVVDSLIDRYMHAERRKIGVWMERDSAAPQWPDWVIGVGSCEEGAKRAATKACPSYGGAHPLGEWLGREGIEGVFVREYHLSPNPMGRVVRELESAGYEVTIVDRPASVRCFVCEDGAAASQLDAGAPPCSTYAGCDTGRCRYCDHAKRCHERATIGGES